MGVVRFVSWFRETNVDLRNLLRGLFGKVCSSIVVRDHSVMIIVVEEDI